MTTKTHAFNYHEEPENSFLKWAMIHFLSGDQTDASFETLSSITDDFKDIKLDIRVNNIQIDAQRFMQRLDEGVDRAIDQGVRDKVQESERFMELDDVVYAFTQDVKRAARQAVKELGIEVDEEDYR